MNRRDVTQRDRNGRASDTLTGSKIDSIGNSPRVPRFLPLLNGFVKSLLRLGLPMGMTTLLTVRGRKTGRPHTVPVGLFEHAGRRYVFATFGEVDWVRNLRGTGSAMIGRGLRHRAVTARELPKGEASSVLKQILAPYLSSRVYSKFLQMGYELTLDSSSDDYGIAAELHPGFELYACE
jgi:deazaflavin-dependent oxidoreductase (nitroreductase family)